MSEFTLSQFSDVIARHNANIGALNNLRDKVRNHAERLTERLMEYPLRSGAQVYWSQSGRRAHIQRCFENDPSYRGTAGSFNLWNGFWQGTWADSWNEPATQFHMWDRTVTADDGQAIQPVTQSKSTFVHRDNFDDYAAPRAAADTRWRTDLGINVWSGDNGLTGWVSKRQDATGTELPHIAYAPNPHTLLWIMQPSATPASGLQTTLDYQADFFLFFEWVNPSSQQYGIHGRPFRFDGSSDIRPGSGEGWTTYAGVERAVAVATATRHAATH